MIVDGSGMLARAFLGRPTRAVPALIFARGVADSSCLDERQYEREISLLRAALDRAAETDVTLVYFSGAHLYGHFESVVSETSAVAPFSRYGVHQVACESIIRSGPARHLVLRLPNVVGAHSNLHQLIPSLVLQAIQGRVMVQADASRDLIGVDDLATITERLLLAGVCNVTVNVASGISTAVPTIVTEIVSTLGLHPEIVSRPGGDHQRFDISFLRNLIGELPFETFYPQRLLRTHVPQIAAWINGLSPKDDPQAG